MVSNLGKQACWNQTTETFCGLPARRTVDIRSTGEILATLDRRRQAGRRALHAGNGPAVRQDFSVHRRADKTCVEGIGDASLPNAVFLEGLRCDGSAHGGCQRGCLFFWKEAWLKPAARPPRPTRPRRPGRPAMIAGGRGAGRLANDAGRSLLLPIDRIGRRRADFHAGQAAVSSRELVDRRDLASAIPSFSADGACRTACGGSCAAGRSIK